VILNWEKKKKGEKTVKDLRKGGKLTKIKKVEKCRTRNTNLGKAS